MRTKKTKIISATTDEAVWLSVGPLLWSRLKGATQQRLLAGVERVTSVRAKLKKKCRVASMPPIEIVGELWVSEGRTGAILQGRAYPLKYKGGDWIGAQLPALTVVEEDAGLVEIILAHEFLHCFHMLRQVFAAMQLGLRGLSEPDYDLTVREADDARLAARDDWFHEDIPGLEHHDTCMPDVDKYFRELCQELPVRTPNPRFRMEQIQFADDVIRHIAMLEGAPEFYWPDWALRNSLPEP